MRKGRILLVGEDKLFGFGLRQTLEQQEDIEIIGDCTSSEEALSQAETLFLNIVLMDASLPEMDAIEACRRLIGDAYACDVIMLPTSQEFIDYAVKAGAAGYFPKGIRHEELVTAIRLACKWQSLRAELDANIYLSHQTQAMIMENLTQFAKDETDNEDEPEWLPPEGNNSDLSQEVTLVIKSAGDVAQLRRFICHVEEVLWASVLETIASWTDTHITLKLERPVPLENVLGELMRMPEVEEAREKTPTRRKLFSFSKKIEAMPKKGISVTLGKQAQLLITTGRANQYLELPKLLRQAVGTMAR